VIAFMCVLVSCFIAFHSQGIASRPRVSYTSGFQPNMTMTDEVQGPLNFPTPFAVALSAACERVNARHSLGTMRSETLEFVSKACLSRARSAIVFTTMMLREFAMQTASNSNAAGSICENVRGYVLPGVRKFDSRANPDQLD
jgi:hypothetical protein